MVVVGAGVAVGVVVVVVAVVVVGAAVVVIGAVAVVAGAAVVVSSNTEAPPQAAATAATAVGVPTRRAARMLAPKEAPGRGSLPASGPRAAYPLGCRPSKVLGAPSRVAAEASSGEPGARRWRPVGVTAARGGSGERPARGPYPE